MLGDGTDKLTDMKVWLQQSHDYKSLIARCGEGTFRLQNDKIYINFTVPLTCQYRNHISRTFLQNVLFMRKAQSNDIRLDDYVALYLLISKRLKNKSCKSKNTYSENNITWHARPH